MSLSPLRVIGVAYFRNVLSQSRSVMSPSQIPRMSYHSVMSPKKWSCKPSCPCANSVCLCMSKRNFHCSRLRQTQADLEIAEFLREEIDHEEQSSSNLSKAQKIHDFSLEQSDNCSITFVRKIENESVKVKFNVNNSIEESGESELNETQPQEPEELKSKPAFTVVIDKAGKKAIHINCVFPPPFAEDGQPPADEYDDMIEIVDITISNNSENVSDTDYSLQGHIMDPNLYDMILGMLEDRGVTANFVQDLVNFSTAYEHEMYVNFLKSLHGLVTSK